MKKLMLTRKLNNKNGKSIFMALFLLLVCVVVSVVIVTVAVTSVMHVEDNHTAQQDYLACSSAAELIKDSLAGGTFTSEVVTKWEARVSSGWNTVTETIEVSDATPDETPTANGMEEFFSSISRAIVDNTWSNSASSSLKDGTFDIEVDGLSTVKVSYKLVTNIKTNESYSLNLKLEVPESEKSYGYVMSMKIPIDKEVTKPSADSNRKETRDCAGYENWRGGTSYHTRYNGGTTHTFTPYIQTTTITWKDATDTSLSISKGTENYE